jgi:hypothetical protein
VQTRKTVLHPKEKVCKDADKKKNHNNNKDRAKDVFLLFSFSQKKGMKKENEQGRWK